MDFETLRFGNFSALGNAVDDWTGMIKSLKTLEEQADRGLKGRADKANWTGVNATVSREFIKETAREFADAHTQATTIRNILRDTRDELIRHREDLKQALERGLKKNLTVTNTSGGFTVTMNVHPDRAAKGTDVPEHSPQDAIALRDEVQVILDAATESDTTAARVLREIADMTEKGFSSASYKDRDAAVADMRKAEADYAAKLAKEVTGEGGTARNYEALKKLEHLIDINSEDPGFSARFYDKLGPEGSLEFYTKMSLDSTGLMGPEAASRTKLVHNIQNDMGTMLGLATSSHFDVKTSVGTGKVPNQHYLGDNWTTQLMKAGREEIDVSMVSGFDTKAYGYQALGALIRDGEYDKDFLTAVGRDMIAMDKKDPGIWEAGTPVDPNIAFNLDKDGGRGFNPITGLMTALGNNPEAATELFHEGIREDSDGDGIVTAADKAVEGDHGKPQGMVDYFLDRDQNADSYDWKLHDSIENRPGQSAIGNALEAAVTQRVPGDADAPPVKHSEKMSDIMERVVAKIGDNPELVVSNEGEDFGPGRLGPLSENFGNMAAEYMPNLQAAAENGAGQIKPFGHMAEFDKGQMAGFLGVVAQDPQAYGAITNAQQAYTTALVHDVFQNKDHYPDMGEAIANTVHPGGEIAGMMTEARAQAVHDTHRHEDGEFNEAAADQAKWVNRTISAAGGKYVELVPFAGDVLGWVQEDVTESVLKHGEKDSSSESRREAATEYSRAETSAKVSAAAAVETGARGTDVDPNLVTTYAGTASRETGLAHSTGRDHVASASPKG
ncbi:DUF6571 family protein [Streptomyces sp. KLOTTS4A1]|uniref:DUF6571 family protein n=1 Tax=Streptomyces sp. KLOTTS4A1 TaxID=3390996 RepID=UPI0039F5651B